MQFLLDLWSTLFAWMVSFWNANVTDLQMGSDFAYIGCITLTIMLFIAIGGVIGNFALLVKAQKGSVFEALLKLGVAGFAIVMVLWVSKAFGLPLLY